MEPTTSEESDKKNLNRIRGIIKRIYTKAVRATRMGSTSYMYPIPLGRKSANAFYLKHIDKILEELHRRFPNSAVAHSIVARGRDGRLYDVSKLDDQTLPLVDRALNNSYIIIDWS